MQRSTEQIVEWNIKKIQSKASCMQQRLKEISQKTRDGRCDDILGANLIVSNMNITMEQLEYEMDRLLAIFSGEGIGTAEKLAETPRKSDFHDRSKPGKDVTSGKQLQQTSGIESGDLKDSLAFNNIIKQIKRLEEIVLSGNIIERIDNIEKEQASRNILPRLEIIEKNLLQGNLTGRFEVLEKDIVVEIRSQLKELEARVEQTLKGVFGDDSGNRSCTPCVVSQLSTMENLLNEGKAQIHGMEEKLKTIESTESHKAVPDPKEKGAAAVKRDEDGDESSGNAEGESSDRDVSFSVTLSHDGPWEDGVVIRTVDHVDHDKGGDFDEDKCSFLAPVDGQYRLSLEVKRSEVEHGSTKVEVWLCGNHGGWVSPPLLYTHLQGSNISRKFKQNLFLKADQQLRLRVFGGSTFERCVFQGELLRQ